MSETIGSISDKLIIENIKVFRLREKYENDKTLTDEQKIELFKLIELINKQRNELSKELDQLVEDWFDNKSIPRTFKRIKV